MENVADNTPPGWIEALDEAEAEIDAGLFVSSEEVHRMLRESIAHLQAKAEERKREAIDQT
jgi:predicted transcriptional regulator